MTTLDYRTLFQLAGDGLVVVDASRRVIEVNEAFANMIGVDRAALVGVYTPELITGVEAQLRAQGTSPMGDGSLAYLGRLRHANGSEIAVEVLATLMPDGTTLGTVRDVRKRALAVALRSARAIAENLNMAIVVTDTENCVLYGNEHLAELTGFSVEEMVGRDFAEFAVTDADRETMVSRMRGRRDGVAEKYEMEHCRKDGSTFTAAISASPMFNENGEVVGSVAVLDDVTDVHALERERSERERRYRSLFEVTPLPTWVYDIETLGFRTVNPAAIAHYGYSESEFLGMTVLDVLTPDRAREITDARRTDSRPAVPVRDEHRRKDGSIMQVTLVSEEFLLDGRESRIVVAQDITDQLRLHERQRSVEEQLRLAQKMEAVGSLAGGVAHDFNNLLSVMLGASESIARDLPTASPLHEDVKDIREAAERGAALTRQLLSLGRKEVRAPVLLDVNTVVANVSRLLFRALGAQVRTDVRPGDGPHSVTADATQLEQVIVNLAINARDAMPNGGTLRITTAKRALAAAEAAAIGVEPGVYVTLAVQDDGAGMDEATRARAFEPFFTTKGPHQGTGLGLSTVYAIARQSGGGITLESVVGEGTRVTIYLPRANQPPRNTPVHSSSGEFRLAGERGRVLLVEDEPRVRAQARRLLERCGFAVTDANDGAEGIFQFRARNGAVDVIVSDVMMPTMGGVEMVSRLRAIAPEVPVVFVSGYTADDRELPLDERTLFVPKPYTITVLCEAIDSLLAGLN
ncbi:MAG: PAS domain S-box protein [bacterium]